MSIVTRLKGIRRKRAGWQAYIRVNGCLHTKSFPITTPTRTMEAWRENTKRDITSQIRYAAFKAKRLPKSMAGWCYVYFVRSDDCIKIGRAIDPIARVRELQTAHAGTLELLAIVAGHMDLETALHLRFEHLRVRSRGEWYRQDDELLTFIQGVQNGWNPVALLFDDPRVIANRPDGG